MPKLHSLKNRPLRALALVLVGTLVVLAAACGGGDKNDDAKTQTTGDPNNITIWAPNALQKPLDTIVQRYKRHQPDINLTVVYGAGNELGDRLLLGETPDLYIGTAIEVQQAAEDGTLPDEQVDFGEDTVVMIVPPANPGNVATLDAFGPLDTVTKTGLCDQRTACGRGGRAVLVNANITATPDVNTPDPKTLLQTVSNAGVDAGLLYRTDAVQYRQKGLVEYVMIPTKSQINVPYQIAIVRHGVAADNFVNYTQTSSGVPKILAQSGFGPLPGDPQ